MKINLSKSITGLTRDITYDATSKIVATGNIKTFWSDGNYEILFKHLNLASPSHLNLKYRNMLDTLKIDSGSILWGKLLGKEKIRSNVNSIIVALDEVEKSSSSYYEFILPKRLTFFNRLKSFYFNDVKHDRLTYDHCRTVTGRTVISSGLNLITMRKEDRKLLQSKYKNGAIIEVDLKSIEPHLYLSLIKGVDVEDAYSFIVTDVLGYNRGEVERKNIKLAFISALYGASERKLKSLSGLSSHDIRKIKNYLQIEQLKKKIEEEFNENGYFENAYGRKIFSINAPVNYFLQSTAVDYACLAFENFMGNLSKEKVDLIAVIVDAILLDVHPDTLESILSVKTITEPIINITAHLSIERHTQ